MVAGKHLADGLLDGILAGKGADGLKRIGQFAPAGQVSGCRSLAEAGKLDALAGFGDIACLFQLVQQLKMAGHIGFQRELVQQRFAEGMDGLDAQSARRVERKGKELACPCQLAGPCRSSEQV